MTRAEIEERLIGPLLAFGFAALKERGDDIAAAKRAIYHAVEAIVRDAGGKIQEEGQRPQVRICILADAICTRKCTDRCLRIDGARPEQWY